MSNSSSVSMERPDPFTTCLVTGGAGFIGCAISARLAQAFGRVIAVDNLHPQIHPTRKRPEALDPAVQLVQADVTEPDTWDRLLGEFWPQVVIHLAAETGTGQSLTEGSRHALVNVVGTTQMLDGFARHQALPRRIVLSSSRAVYGEGAWRDSAGAERYPGQRSDRMLAAAEWDFPGMISESFVAGRTQTHPTSIYGATKLAQEHVLSSWTRSFNVALNVLRLQNVYGPGQSLSNPYTGIVSLFARMAKAGKSIPLYEDGAMRRDFVFITDVADAIIRCSVDEMSGVLADVGTGASISIAELAHEIAVIYGAPAPHVTGQYRNGDVRHAACSDASARAGLGWSAKVPVREGVRQLCAWIDQQPSELTKL
ncbi:NAD-dependent epimerase/dehydratase family protein [Rhodanobacter sp. DHB23]|uniref:NAD-dependent epimerase/dehydratase family protein n=1 Tax=Rhodanobacter sp. DHB23 TaxID=2775923 RepID=UPI0017875D6B|nr:NAD-dependent epimerase/dehydratase family protein [Rhodanobacter sp. DHB23]MBD8873277.1 NAD-dependent epimerase/dehydratase family protein [Rhodanobacter sp. DHB23]